MQLSRVAKVLIGALLVCGSAMFGQTSVTSQLNSAQTISFDAIPSQILGVSPFPVVAQASSGLPVTIASTTTSVCATSGSLVLLLTAGSCSITASQSGNGSYLPATPVTKTFTIAVANLSGSFIAAPGGPIPTGTYPFAVTVADFNNDGNQDLATSDRSGNIGVFLGNGSGGFAAVTGSPFATGSTTVAIGLVAGDFDADGNQDIAVANYTDGTVTVMMGNGTGALSVASGSPITTGSFPTSIAVGDFNSDGIEDLAVTNYGYSNVSILLGNGSGGFTLVGTPVQAGSGAGGVAVGDFNGDGIQDLAVADLIGNAVTILLGNGSGSFAATAGSPIATGSVPLVVVAGDFNHDGHQDIAVANQGASTVSVFLGNGAGVFTAAPGSPFTVGASPYSLVAADFNGDGIQDLATVNYLGNNVTVLLGNGSGSFTAASTSPLAVGGGPGWVAVGDFNRDGIVDLATVNGLDNDVTVFLGLKPGTAPQTIAFGPLSNQPIGTLPYAIGATASSGLPVSFNSNNTSICMVSGNTVTVLMSGGCSITATQTGSAVYAVAAPVTQKFTVLFNDVSPTASYYNEVNTFAQYGITAGCGSNNFCPELNVTRDQMAIFIVRAIYGNDNFTYNTTPYFTDVTPSTFGFKWIQKLKDLAITSGCTATTYCPGLVVTRDQMAVFIIRARLGLYLAGGQSPLFTYPATPYFTDATASNEFAFPWIQRMKLDKITSGCTVTAYCPSLAVTRGDMAVFIMRGAFNQYLPTGTPLLTQISPSTLAPGASDTFTITGTDTNFVQGTTQLSPIPGLTIGTISVTSATTMTVQLTASSGAVTQPYSILATTGSEQDVLPNGLVIQ
jgi:FG-GAP-like repeat/S-layer homology domain